MKTIPTEQQIKLVLDITRVLDIDFPQSSRDFNYHIYEDFINQNMDEYFQKIGEFE